MTTRSSKSAQPFLAPFLCVLAGACAHAAPALPSSEVFRAFDCPAGDTSEASAFGHALKLAVDVDHVTVISHGGGHDDLTVGERGTPCAGATSPSTCADELSRQRHAWLEAQPSCADCPGTTLVLTTSGDEVASWTSPGEVLTLLGPIDSPADAWLVLMTRHGLPPYACGDAKESAYRFRSDGIELSRQEWSSTCRPTERVEIIEGVDRAGTVTLLSRRVVERETDGCVVP